MIPSFSSSNSINKNSQTISSSQKSQLSSLCKDFSDKKLKLVDSQASTENEEATTLSQNKPNNSLDKNKGFLLERFLSDLNNYEKSKSETPSQSSNSQIDVYSADRKSLSAFLLEDLSGDLPYKNGESRESHQNSIGTSLHCEMESKSYNLWKTSNETNQFDCSDHVFDLRSKNLANRQSTPLDHALKHFDKTEEIYGKDDQPSCPVLLPPEETMSQENLQLPIVNEIEMEMFTRSLSQGDRDLNLSYTADKIQEKPNTLESPIISTNAQQTKILSQRESDPLPTFSSRPLAEDRENLFPDVQNFGNFHATTNDNVPQMFTNKFKKIQEKPNIFNDSIISANSVPNKALSQRDCNLLPTFSSGPLTEEQKNFCSDEPDRDIINVLQNFGNFHTTDSTSIITSYENVTQMFTMELPQTDFDLCLGYTTNEIQETQRSYHSPTSSSNVLQTKILSQRECNLLPTVSAHPLTEYEEALYSDDPGRDMIDIVLNFGNFQTTEHTPRLAVSDSQRSNFAVIEEINQSLEQNDKSLRDLTNLPNCNLDVSLPLSTGSNENFNESQKRLRCGLNRITMDRELRYEGPKTLYESKIEEKKRTLICKVERLFYKMLTEAVNEQALVLLIRTRDWNNCIFENEILKLKKAGECNFQVLCYNSRGRKRFNLIVYLLGKMYNLVLRGSTYTQREIYYQLVKYTQSQQDIRNTITTISDLLDIEPWYLPIVATSKGLAFGPFTIYTSLGEVINFDLIGGTLIPQTVITIIKVVSEAYFVLVVEKDAVFKKLVDENFPNKLTRPFILVTGKGVPDVNTRLFLRILRDHLRIPIFILVDADPYGIDIMSTYKYGSLNMAHVSEHLAIPTMKWLGVLPSEIIPLGIVHTPLTPNDKIKIKTMLKRRPFMNEQMRNELNILLENNFKAEIEGVIKTHSYLTDFYLANKFATQDYL
ncbi:hypothetical protein RI129_004839 [Pyrocoelia pectoralis]|uniref:DNA topoisomerase (ATP-hydrolyzing) n=1 Tax=Pyrocoelia pectoralis TaxID=417401 RepID=A0AAN7VD34_9COLE